MALPSHSVLQSMPYLLLHWAKAIMAQELQNVGAGDPSSTILVDHGSYVVLPTPQLGWLTRGVDTTFWPPWKYVGRVRICFDPLKMLHSFIQNCCWITASFTASRMNRWTLPLHLHWSCLCWRCYHPYIWSAPSRQCPPINAFAAILDTYRGQRQNSKTWMQMTRHQQSS